MRTNQLFAAVVALAFATACDNQASKTRHRTKSKSRSREGLTAQIKAQTIFGVDGGGVAMAAAATQMVQPPTIPYTATVTNTATGTGTMTAVGSIVTKTTTGTVTNTDTRTATATKTLSATWRGHWNLHRDEDRHADQQWNQHRDQDRDGHCILDGNLSGHRHGDWHEDPDRNLDRNGDLDRHAVHHGDRNQDQHRNQVSHRDRRRHRQWDGNADLHRRSNHDSYLDRDDHRNQHHDRDQNRHRGDHRNRDQPHHGDKPVLRHVGLLRQLRNRQRQRLERAAGPGAELRGGRGRQQGLPRERPHRVPGLHLARPSRNGLDGFNRRGQPQAAQLLVTSATVSLWGRYDATYNADCGYYVSLRGDGKVALGKRVVGVNTALGSPVAVPGGISTGTWYDVKLDMQGTRSRPTSTGRSC
jgi:hypothetical protein